VPAELHGWLIPISALRFVRVHVVSRDPVEGFNSSISYSGISGTQE